MTSTPGLVSSGPAPPPTGRTTCMDFGRNDYTGRIVDTHALIPADEPCLLLRGQDVAAPSVLLFWAHAAESHGADPVLVANAREHARRMVAWQETHAAKTPDAPDGSLEHDADPVSDQPGFEVFP